MKNAITLALLLVLAATPTLGHPRAQEAVAAPLDAALRSADSERRALSRHIGGFPPNFDADVSREVATARLNKLIADLSELAKTSPKNAEIEWRLGDAYRMGHNLDLPKAWESSEAVLKSAIEHDSKCVEAYTTLGGLYVDSSTKLAGEAERLFKKAIDVAGDRPVPKAYRGLVFAYVMMRDGKKALKAADECLKRYPDETVVAAIREQLRKNPRIAYKEMPPP